MNKNAFENFTISYPAINPGTAKSTVTFHEGTPDLLSIYKVGEENPHRYIFITDATVATLPCMKDFIAKFDDGKCGNDLLLILGSGEPYKTIESVLTIDQTALDAGFSRSDIFVGIGGGVITDITGFASSIYKRGAVCEFIPTTLLAMVDASIGGKTGCDFKSYKNMIGAFYPAQSLHFFPDFVKSLSEEQFRSGLGEAFKTALLYDKELFELFKKEPEKIKNRDSEIIFNVIQKCVQAKAHVVEEDFTEKNIRMFLNLGHTFGHALETIVGLGIIPHGDAVAWGIGRAAELAVKLDLSMDSFRKEVFELLEAYGWNTEKTPSFVQGGGAAERIVNAMHKDKKNSSGAVRVVLQKGLNDTLTMEVTDAQILSVLR